MSANGDVTLEFRQNQTMILPANMQMGSSLTGAFEKVRVGSFEGEIPGMNQVLNPQEPIVIDGLAEKQQIALNGANMSNDLPEAVSGIRNMSNDSVATLGTKCLDMCADLGRELFGGIFSDKSETGPDLVSERDLGLQNNFKPPQQQPGMGIGGGGFGGMG